MIYKPKRPIIIKAADALVRMLDRFGGHTLSIDEEAFLRKARKKTGLHDFGDDSFREPLAILCKEGQSGKSMTALGRLMFKDNLLTRLKNRLKLEAEYKAHPEILDQVIEKPIIIAGLARTGSTFLQRLLAQDPANRSPLNWEMNAPVPPPEPASFETDSRINKDQPFWTLLNFFLPRFKAIHEVGAILPDECLSLMANNLISGWFVIGLDSNYLDWILEKDLTHAYRLHKRHLQLLQWKFPPLCWVLKSPWHLLGLDAILNVYPDARIIQTHRSPLEALPSCASFMREFREAQYPQVDLDALGREWLRIFVKWFEKGIADRDQAEKQTNGRFHDVYYTDLTADPLACVEKIYADFDMKLSDDALTRMREYIKKNPQHKHGKHRYSLEEFGLDRETVNRHFAPYYQRFNLTP